MTIKLTTGETVVIRPGEVLRVLRLSDNRTYIVAGWSGLQQRGESTDGYRAHDWVREGKYLGPDVDGVEPLWSECEVLP